MASAAHGPGLVVAGIERGRGNAGEKGVDVMNLSAAALSGIIGAMAVLLAGSTIWLLLTDPVTVVGAVSAGDATPLVRALAVALCDALQRLLQFL